MPFACFWKMVDGAPSHPSAAPGICEMAELLEALRVVRAPRWSIVGVGRSRAGCGRARWSGPGSAGNRSSGWGDLTRAVFEAADAGADIAFLLDQKGNVTEGPGFNVFAIINGTVVSPDRGALEGITRKSVFELCQEMGIPVEIRPLHVSELEGADELLTATTAGGVMPVSRLDGRIYSNDRPGPISAKLRAAYWAKHDQGWHATPIQYD
jgi:hypothetical protein